MENIITTPPAPPKEDVTPKPQDTGVMSAEDLKRQLEEANRERETLQKRVKDQETMIGKQSTEIGSLRKRELIEKTKSAPEGEKDELLDELKTELMKEGYSEDDAMTNAKILTKSTNKIIERRENQKMMNDVLDLIEENLDEGKLDRKVFEENQDAVMDEFRGRKLAPTARKNFRIFKDCYEAVIRRKADAMKQQRKEGDETKREALIGEGQIPPPGANQEGKLTSEEEEVAKKIREAGPKHDSEVFF